MTLNLYNPLIMGVQLSVSGITIRPTRKKVPAKYKNKLTVRINEYKARNKVKMEKKGLRS